MSYKANQSIVFEGSSIDGVFIIYSGVVKIYVKGHNGKTFIVRLAKPGEIIGHAADHRLKQPFGATAVEPTTVCFIETLDFEKGFENCPGIRNELVSIFKNEIKYIGYRTIQLVQMSVREKIADALLYIAQVYGLKEGGKEKHIALSRQDISEMTGTTKEQVSKVISELRNESIISCQGKKLAILNHARLKEVTGVF